MRIYLIPILFVFLIRTTVLCSENALFLDQNDMDSLRPVIERWLKYETLGHTLYGNKPLCPLGFHIRDKIDSNHPCYQYSNFQKTILEDSAYEALKKLVGIRNNFSISLKETQDSFGYCVYELSVINIRALKKVVQKNLKLFQNSMKLNFTPSEIVAFIQTKSFYDNFRNFPALQGIILGYGTENSLTWENMIQLLKEVNLSEKGSIHVTPNFLNDSNQKKVISNYVSSHRPDLNTFYEELKEFKINNVDGVKIHFFSNPNKRESKKIMKDLKKAEKKTERLLNNKHFIDKFLHKICS